MKKLWNKERLEKIMRNENEAQKEKRPVGRPPGWKMSDEHKQIISDANTGSGSYLWGLTGDSHPLWGNKEKAKDAAAKIGMKNSISNRKMKLIKNGDQIRSPYEQIMSHLEDGWFFKATKINVNNGEKTKMINSTDWEMYIADGWNWGSLSTYKEVN